MSQLSKQIILEIMWKFSRDIVAQKCSLPVSASHMDSVDSPLDLKTPARIITSKYARHTVKAHSGPEHHV